MATQIIVPILGEAISEAVLESWLKQPGETVKRGEEIAMLETEKATMPLESPVNGVILDILVTPGTTVIPGQLLAVIGKPGELVTKVEAGEVPPPEARAEKAVETTVPAPGISSPTVSPDFSTRRRVSPAAQRMAKVLGVDINMVHSMREGARITTQDVQRYLDSQAQVPKAPSTGAEPAAAPAPSASPSSIPAKRVPLNLTRRIVAKRMLESARTIPQFSVSMEARVNRIFEVKTELAARRGNISFTSLLVYMTARSLSRYPWLNASADGEELLVYETVNIAVAVATDHGLMVPVIHGVEQKGLEEINQGLGELIDLAKRNRLSLDQVNGATFTISNLGTYGVHTFIPLVNPPQAAILGIGSDRYSFLPTPFGGLEPVRLVSLTVSADHRVVDGAYVAEFLANLKDEIERADIRS